jgi:hypothetical protein
MKTLHARSGLLITLFLLCGGCLNPSGLFGERTQSFGDGNYLTTEHAFTDASAENARRSAMQHCGYKNRVAVKTSSSCSLKTCTTHYQCMDRKDAENFQADPGNK